MNKTAIYSKERVNTGRQIELDVVKALTIILMVLCHTFDETLNFDSGVATVLDDYLAQIMGASTFMICMGMSMFYTRHDSPKDFLFRGIEILTIGQVLLLLRDVLPSFIAYEVTGNTFFFAQMALVFSNDILQMAGLTFMLIALLKKLNARPFYVFIAGCVLNIIGSFLGQLEFENYFLNQLWGNLVSTHTESYFPFFSWFVFPAFGFYLGDLFTHITDKSKFYHRVYLYGLPASVIFYTLRFCGYLDILGDPTDFIALIRISIVDAAFSLLLNVVVLGIVNDVLCLIKAKSSGKLHFISRHINKYYCISWVIIRFVRAYLLVTLGDYLYSTLGSAAIGIAIFLACTGIILLYEDFKKKHPAKKKTAGQKAALACAVWLLCGVIAAYVFPRVEEYPNWENEYLLDAEIDYFA